MLNIHFYTRLKFLKCYSYWHGVSDSSKKIFLDLYQQKQFSFSQDSSFPGSQPSLQYTCIGLMPRVLSLSRAWIFWKSIVWNAYIYLYMQLDKKYSIDARVLFKILPMSVSESVQLYKTLLIPMRNRFNSKLIKLKMKTPLLFKSNFLII